MTCQRCVTAHENMAGQLPTQHGRGLRVNNIYALIMQMELNQWEDEPVKESLGLSAGRMEALIQREPENVRGLIQDALNFYANIFDGAW